MKRNLFFALLVTLLFAGMLSAEMERKAPEVTDIRQAFITGSLIVKGEGSAPVDTTLGEAQKRILALRSAKVVALREAIEIINGVRVNGETTIVNAASQSDVIRAAVHGVVKGAEVINEAYDPVSGTAVVHISIPLTGPNGLVGALVPQVSSVLPRKNPAYRPADALFARTYDGLIVDCGEMPFKPALINRILTKDGEVIYDPSNLPKNVLEERGAAGYTNDLDKARALLAERGSKNPLIVRVSGIRNSTDAEVPPEDAKIIFGSNQDNNYLQAAKVVFVLK